MKCLRRLFAVFILFLTIECSCAYTLHSNNRYIGVYADGQHIDWYTARDFCETKFGTHLASIHTSDDNALASLAARNAGVKKYAWFGLNDIKSEGVFEYVDGTSFVDGDDFTAWRASNPDNWGSGEDCVHYWVEDDTWNDLPCQNAAIIQGFVCNLPNYYTSYDNGKYVGVSTNGRPIDWFDGLHYCQNKMGTTLGSIHSETDISSAIDAVHQSKILDSVSNLNRAWFGLNKILNDIAFNYTDSTGVDFENWGSGEPNDYNNNENCVEFDASTGKWNDLACTNKNSGLRVTGFICNSPQLLEYSNSQKHHIYNEKENEFYIGVDTANSENKINWFDALDYCENVIGDGSTLASIHNNRDLINAMAVSNGKNGHWIGLNDIIKEGTYGYTDGCVHDNENGYSNWHPNAPSNQDSKDCVYLTENGQWIDHSCSGEISAFLCNSPNECKGCRYGGNGNGEACYDLLGNSNVFACRATFFGGMESVDTNNICSTNYHICQSATEVTNLGLSTSICETIIFDNEVYLSKETSDGKSRCQSKHGKNNYYEDDIWGCGGKNINLLSDCCRKVSNCKGLNIKCGNKDCLDNNEKTIFGGLSTDTKNEYNFIYLSDYTYGGVLCCIDTF